LLATLVTIFIALLLSPSFLLTTLIAIAIPLIVARHSRRRCHHPRCHSPSTLTAIAIALATIAIAITIACHPRCH
jgi:hypothetical protein